MTLIAVTGMHRSGTSTLAGILRLLGATFGGDESLLPAHDDNPRGYFENKRIVQFDDTLLGHLGGWWHILPPLPAEWPYDWTLEPFRVWGAQLVADHLSSGPINGFKDPRVSVLLPFWRTVVSIDATVHSVRHPVAVAASLRARDGFEVEHSAYLWLRYTLAAAHHDPDRVDVFYDDWFDDPASPASAVALHLGLPPVEADTMAEIVHFVSPSLRRQDETAPGADAGGEFMSSALQVYGRLRTSGIPADEVASLHDDLAARPGPTDGS